MLHFIVQAIEDKHRDLLSFSDDFYSLSDSVSKSEFVCSLNACEHFPLVNILELQKQPKEITRELKSAREELDIARNVEEPIQGDKFAESVEVKFFIIKSSNDRRTFDLVFQGFYHSSRR